MDYKTFSSLSEDELWEKLMDGGIKIMMTAQEELDFGITDNSPLHEEVYSFDIKSIEEISEEEIERAVMDLEKSGIPFQMQNPRKT